MTSGVQLGDIADIEGFVRSTIRRKMNRVPRDEVEELVAEGLVIVCDLWRKYDPSKDSASRKPNHVCRGPRCCVPSFAGYCTFLLPPKLLDAWHSLHPEHLLRTQADGKRKYVYLQGSCSLDEGATGTVNEDDRGYSSVDNPNTRHVGNFITVPEAA